MAASAQASTKYTLTTLMSTSTSPHQRKLRYVMQATMKRRKKREEPMITTEKISTMKKAECTVKKSPKMISTRETD